MAKSFESLWEAMETRRRQFEAGAMPLPFQPEHLRQEQQQARGCPDVEALCGWVDGQLRRASMRRWLVVWRHVQLRSCRGCQEKIAMLAAGMRLIDEVQSPHQHRSPWLRDVLSRSVASLLPAPMPLAWMSGTLVVAVGLSLWLLSEHGLRDTDGYRMTIPRTEVRSERPQSSFEPTPKDHAVQPIIWGD